MYNQTVLKHQNNRDYNYQGRKGKKIWFSFFGGSSEEKSNVNNLSELTPDFSSYPLSQAKQGSSVYIVGFRSNGGNGRLLGMGLSLGVKLDVIHSQPSGSVIVSIQGNQLALGGGMAEKILVSNEPVSNNRNEIITTDSRLYLREMAIGTQARIIGYDKAIRSYKGKLLSMGLTPNTEFTLIRVAPLGDPVEIRVRGFSLSLRKQEADALMVEIVDPVDS